MNVRYWITVYVIMSATLVCDAYPNADSVGEKNLRQAYLIFFNKAQPKNTEKDLSVELSRKFSVGTPRDKIIAEILRLVAAYEPEPYRALTVTLRNTIVVVHIEGRTDIETIHRLSIGFWFDKEFKLQGVGPSVSFDTDRLPPE